MAIAATSAFISTRPRFDLQAQPPYAKEVGSETSRNAVV